MNSILWNVSWLNYLDFVESGMQTQTDELLLEFYFFLVCPFWLNSQGRMLSRPSSGMCKNIVYKYSNTSTRPPASCKWWHTFLCFLLSCFFSIFLYPSGSWKTNADMSFFSHFKAKGINYSNENYLGFASLFIVC